MRYNYANLLKIPYRNDILPSTFFNKTSHSLLHIQIQPVLFFPKIVIKVAHLLAAELEHLVMEVPVVTSDKVVGEFMDTERLETLLGTNIVNETAHAVAISDVLQLLQTLLYPCAKLSVSFRMTDIVIGDLVQVFCHEQVFLHS